MADIAKRLVLLNYNTQEARGGWFEVTHRTALTQAARSVGHILFEVERVKLDQIDPDMPGGAFAPNGRPEPLPVMLRATFDRLMAMVKAGQVGKVVGLAGNTGIPVPWTDIKVGWVVLASDDRDEGWWEAVVTAVVENGQTLQLRWRDFEGTDWFSKHITRVGLMSPSSQR